MANFFGRKYRKNCISVSKGFLEEKKGSNNKRVQKRQSQRQKDRKT